MRFTSYGMFEAARNKLALAISQNLGLNKEKIDSVLLEAVITDIISASYDFKKKLINENSNLSIAEIGLKTFEHSLTIILPSLMRELNQSAESLKIYSDVYCSEANQLYKQNESYISEIIVKMEEAKKDALNEYYGKGFSIKYPGLVPSLLLNDQHIMNAAYQMAIKGIEKCPSNVQSILKQHLNYLGELGKQTPLNTDFPKLFEQTVGMSMEKYKENKANSSYSLGSFRSTSDVSKNKSEDESNVSCRAHM